MPIGYPLNPLPNFIAVEGLCYGPDGNFWVVGYEGDPDLRNVIRVTPSGGLTYYTAASGDSLSGVCVGTDGNLWASNAGAISGTQGAVKITTSGVGTPYPFSPTTLSNIQDICTHTDGYMYLADVSGPAGTGGGMWQLSYSGSYTYFPFASLSNSLPQPFRICSGPDGNLWLGDPGTGGAGSVSGFWRCTPSGVNTFFPAGFEIGYGICVGSDGNLWSPDSGNGLLWQCTTSGTLTSFNILNGYPETIGTGYDGNLWVGGTGPEGGGPDVPVVSTSGSILSTYVLTGYTRITPWRICQGPPDSMWTLDNWNGVLYNITASPITQGWHLGSVEWLS